jgi:hypothetical protein
MHAVFNSNTYKRKMKRKSRPKTKRKENKMRFLRGIHMGSFIQIRGGEIKKRIDVGRRYCEKNYFLR